MINGCEFMKKIFIILFCMVMFFGVPKNTFALEKNYNSREIQEKSFYSSNTPILVEFAPSDEEFCDEDIKALIRKYWKWITIIAPIGLMFLIIVDFLKAMINNDSDAVKKSSSNAIKRTIATMLLLISPWFLSIVFNLFGLDICF